MLTDTTKSPYAKAVPLSENSTHWTKGFWKDAININADSTIPHLEKMFTSKDISHVLENFKICAGDSKGSFDGTVFGDGDFYKWIEAASYTAVETNNKELLKRIDEYIELIGRAQLPDGYISTKQIIGEREENGIGRLGDINDFEVYNFGHLFTTASLHKRLTGKDNFLVIAEKAAEYLNNLFINNEKTGDVQTAVCPSHFMGILELYRTTGKKKYLELGKLAIRIRDNVKNGLDDNQDRVPVKEHERIIGHAVRANYLYAGIADLCLESCDEEYLDVLNKVWNNLITQKMYITGGCGALYNGASPYGNFFVHQLVHQAYGYEYQLPNITAYNETCAGIGAVMWAYRMFQLNPDAEFFDIIEQIMLNTNMAAVSLDGRKFFYENMLRRTKKLPYELIWPLTRSEYILSYCCPPNLARVIAESSEYAYAVSNDTLWLGLYGANESDIELKSGTRFKIRQETNYPYSGEINLYFSEVTEPFNINIRIPKWAKDGTINTGANSYILTSDNSGTYYTIKITDNTTVNINFEMTAHYTIAHPLVEENTNQVAVERGPLVYCIEGVDTSVNSLDDILMDPDAVFEPIDFKIKNREITALMTDAYQIVRSEYDTEALYQPLPKTNFEKIPLRLIPYFAWDNREYGEMKIWISFFNKI